MKHKKKNNMSNMKQYYARRNELLDEIQLTTQNFILRCKMKDRDIDMEHELYYHIMKLSMILNNLHKENDILDEVNKEIKG